MERGSKKGPLQEWLHKATQISARFGPFPEITFQPNDFLVRGERSRKKTTERPPSPDNAVALGPLSALPNIEPR